MMTMLFSVKNAVSQLIPDNRLKHLNNCGYLNVLIDMLKNAFVYFCCKVNKENEAILRFTGSCIKKRHKEG